MSGRGEDGDALERAPLMSGPAVDGTDPHDAPPAADRFRTPRTGRKWELNEAMNRIGVGRFQILMFLLCGLSEAANGIQQLSVSFLLHYLGELYHLSNHGKALVGSVAGLGMAIGATVFGRVSDIKGRRYAFTASLLTSGVLGVLCAASPSFGVFLVFRGLLSIGIGGNVPLAFSVYTEMSPKRSRGLYLTSLEAFWSVGAVVSCVLALLLLPSAGWKYYQLACSVPALLLAFVVVFNMPETPRYLVVSGRVREAQLTLQKMADANGKPKLKKFQLRASLEKHSFNHSFSSLFEGAYLRTTLLLFALFFLLSFGCGVFVWLPVLLREKGFEVQSMYRSMILMATCQVPGVLAAAYMVENFGRKKAVGFFFLAGAVSMTLFALSSAEASVVSSSLLMEFFLAGSNGALSAYTVEVFPTSLRSSAMGACSALSRFSSVVNPTIWAALIDLSPNTAIMAGALALFGGVACISLLQHETRDEDLADDVSSSGGGVKAD